MAKVKYYDLSNILKYNARYNLIFGERSNGKTYQVQLYGVKKYLEDGSKIAVIRRWREDFRGKRGGQYFNNLTYNGKGENVIKKLTKGKFDQVVYRSSSWFLAYFDEESQTTITEPEPFAYAFALTEMEHDKGNSYNINTVLFDEFMTRGAYLPDEFVSFMNTLSTIIRARDTVKIFMCANTVSKYCPYFNEMGLKHVKQMKKGDIDLYKYTNEGLTVAVEYSDSPNISKPSDVYFAFDNPKLQMITTGTWELDLYPHLTEKIEDKDILFSYFIEFDNNLLQADIIITSSSRFTFIHNKTTPIKKPDEDIIFTTEASEHMNRYTSLLKPIDKISTKIITFFSANKVFYQTNEIGEIVNQYLNTSRRIAMT